MKLWKVIWGGKGFKFEDVFDDRTDAHNFAKDREVMGFQCKILEVPSPADRRS